MSNHKGNKLLDFLAGKGFYVVLILCVAAIGVSGYMLFFGGSGDETPDSPSLALVSPVPSPSQPSPSARVPVPSSSPILPSPPRQVLVPSPSPLPQVGTQEDDTGVDGDLTDPDDNSVETAGDVTDMPDVPADEPPEEQTPVVEADPTFFMPVNGALLLVPYSESADVFYEYLREWRYHPGIDLETNAGALVQCAADGVVKEVIESAARSMGTTIVIEHANGFETVYSNLLETVKVTVGQSVSAGETIAAVGETAVSELALPPHLHFEILKDGEPVDPLEYLPEQ